MESPNNPTNFDIQCQNLFDTKKFGYRAKFRPMADESPWFREDLNEVQLRLRGLVQHYADGNGVAFAAEIDVPYRTLSAALNSGQLSKAVAFKIINRYPDISLPWLWGGATDGQIPSLTRQLEKAMERAAAEYALPYATPSRKGTMRESS